MSHKYSLYTSYGKNSHLEILGRTEPELVFCWGAGVILNIGLHLFANDMSYLQSLWVTLAIMLPLAYLTMVFCVVRKRLLSFKCFFFALQEDKGRQPENGKVEDDTLSPRVLEEWVVHNGFMRYRVADLIRVHMKLLIPFALTLFVTPLGYPILSNGGKLPVIPNQGWVVPFMMLVGHFHLIKIVRLQSLGLDALFCDGWMDMPVAQKVSPVKSFSARRYCQ